MERDADIENRLMDAEGWGFRGGAGGERMEWDGWREQHGNIYTTICKKDSQWELAV